MRVVPRASTAMEVERALGCERRRNLNERHEEPARAVDGHGWAQADINVSGVYQN